MDILMKLKKKKILASDEQASSFKEIFEKELSIDQKKLFWKLVKNADLFQIENFNYLED